MNVLLVKPSYTAIANLQKRFRKENIVVFESYNLDDSLRILRDTPIDMVLVFIKKSDPEISEIYNILAFSFEDISVIGLMEDEIGELKIKKKLARRKVAGSGIISN